MLLITATSSIPMDSRSVGSGPLTSLAPIIQNLLHIPVFGLLAYLWLRAFCTSKRPFAICWMSALLFTIAFGVVDELHQAHVPGRYAGLLDIALNIIGAGLGIAVFSWQRASGKFLCGRPDEICENRPE